MKNTKMYSASNSVLIGADLGFSQGWGRFSKFVYLFFEISQITMKTPFLTIFCAAVNF